MITNIVYKEFTEMTISERTFSRKNAESCIFPYKVILLLVTYYILESNSLYYVVTLKVIYYVT